MTIRSFLFALTIAAAFASHASAHEVIYTAFLSGRAESPPNASPGGGFVTITIDFDLFTMRVEANFSNLQGATTTAHIHAATAAPFTGAAGIATQTPSFEAFPGGVTNGIYDHTFDLADASSYNPEFIAANGGTLFTASNALFAALDQGRAYLDIHTSAFSDGEIRGFLQVPVRIVSVTRLAGNTVHLECIGRPEMPNRIESSPDLNEANFTTVAAVKADDEGAFEYDDPNPGARKFYRARFP